MQCVAAARDKELQNLVSLLSKARLWAPGNQDYASDHLTVQRHSSR